MNNDLLKRIDSLLGARFKAMPVDTRDLLEDCRAEIASCNEAAQQQAVVIERLSKPYVAMTDDERHTVFTEAEMNRDNGLSAIEHAVIKRLGLEIKHD